MKHLPLVLLVLLVLIAMSTERGLGQTWTQTGAPITNWGSIASSADGKKLVAAVKGGPIYMSRDSGATWTVSGAPSTHWSSVASSADGSKLIAAVAVFNGSQYESGGPIYVSADSGATWTETSAPITNWAAVTSSADGRNLVAAAGGTILYVSSAPSGPIYHSSNSGMTWTLTSVTNANCTSLASSADGNRVVAACYAGPFYFSTNGAEMWNDVKPDFPYLASVASSADGTILLAGYFDPFHGPGLGGHFGALISRDAGGTWNYAPVGDTGRGLVASSADGSCLVVAGGANAFGTGGPIFVSTNTGATWTTAGAPIAKWSSVACSADGSKVFAVANDGGIWTLRWIPPDWVQTTVPSNYWAAVVSSADGSKLAAAGWGSPIYISTNSGATWTTTALDGSGVLACSADGNELVTSYGIYTSTGSDWTLTGTVPAGAISAAVSADGRKVMVQANGWAHTSTDSGANWTSNNLSASFSASTSSADGTKLASAGGGLGYVGPIVTSDDSGATWRITSAPLTWWYSISSSADGSKLAAAGQAGLYTSADAGITWTPHFAVGSQVAASADGSRLLGYGYGGIFASTNFGETWQQSDASEANWSAAASSADGHKLVAAVSGGGIWISRSRPQPALRITFSRTDLVVSWTVSSGEFRLQANANISTGDWEDVPLVPLLNLTNLEHQVTVLPQTAARFYRLKGL